MAGCFNDKEIANEISGEFKRFGITVEGSDHPATVLGEGIQTTKRLFHEASEGLDTEKSPRSPLY